MMRQIFTTLAVVSVVVAVITGCGSTEPTRPQDRTSFEIRGSITRMLAEDIGSVEVWLDSAVFIPVKPDGTYTFPTVTADTHHIEVRARFPIRVEPSSRTVIVDDADVDSADFQIAHASTEQERIVTTTTVAGSFYMGCNVSDHFADVDWATPKHWVTITKQLDVAIYETTQAQWMRVMKHNPSDVVGSQLPVTNLTYDSVITFCNRLSEIHGYTPVYSGSGSSVIISATANGFRLPTEAEWEYVASAGSTTAFSGLPDTVPGRPLERIFDDVNEIAWWGNNLGGANAGVPQPVGGRRPNAWGLFDVHGNVAEMVEGALRRYTREPSTDPIMLPYNNALVYRGGSYKDVLWAPWLITLRGRRSVRFNDAFPIVGFRVVRTR